MCEIISEQDNIKRKIRDLEAEMNENINNIKESYMSNINKLKLELHKEKKKEESNKLLSLREVETKIEFNDWWQLYVNVYEKVYKSHDKYYYIEYDEKDSFTIKEIEILNSFGAVNINNIIYVKNIKYDENTIEYLYIDITTNDYYIYHKKKWLKYEY
jgi:hypothetical protein